MSLQERAKFIREKVSSYIVTANEVKQFMDDLQCTEVEVAKAVCFGVALPATVSPISHFAAGAVAIGISGAMYVGFNIEFLGLPLNEAVHAEQCAISNALLHKEPFVKTMVTCPSPCGHCRQFMRECKNAATTLTVHSCSKPDGEAIFSALLTEILPFSFGPEDLDSTLTLFDPNGLRFEIEEIQEGVTTDFIEKAMDLLPLCYSPHSKSWACVVIHWRDDNGTMHISSGVYLENCAYNPSLSPLQCAMVSFFLGNGSTYQSIEQVVIFEDPKANVQHYPKTQLLIQHFAPQAILTQQAIKINK